MVALNGSEAVFLLAFKEIDYENTYSLPYTGENFTQAAPPYGGNRQLNMEPETRGLFVFIDAFEKRYGYGSPLFYLKLKKIEERKRTRILRYTKLAR